uniref:Uncharacterized protein n=1 Tax=viral metagenome TaxID=1070528 RepID=A0A6C0AEW1_9ZZZZ
MNNEKLTDYQLTWIIYIYIGFIIFWIILVWFFELYNKITSIILIIPIVIFLTNLYNIESFSEETCAEIFETSFITIGIIFAIPFLTLINKESGIDVTHVTQLIILAVVLILCSYFHIFTSPEGIIIWKHFTNCFETMAITIFIYCLLTYFLVFLGYN